jgi:NCS1 family nucleobase:cation symporter-1
VETLTGFSSIPLFTIVCQTIVVLLALFGHHGIERVEPFIAVVMIGLALFVFYKAFSTFGTGEFVSLPGDPSAGMTAAIALDVVVATATPGPFSQRTSTGTPRRSWVAYSVR